MTIPVTGGYVEGSNLGYTGHDLPTPPHAG